MRETVYVQTCAELWCTGPLSCHREDDELLRGLEERAAELEAGLLLRRLDDK
jgi:hypothetical protein